MRAVGSGGGGGFGAGGPRAVTPGVAGSRFVTSGVAGPRLVTPGVAGRRFVTPGAGSRFVTPGVAGRRFVTPQGRATIRPGIVPGTPRVYARHGVQRLSGAHYPRYRRRNHRFRYYHGGWWYANPWWIGGDCEYWSNVCASQWGYDTGGYYSCMSDYGCY